MPNARVQTEKCSRTVLKPFLDEPLFLYDGLSVSRPGSQISLGTGPQEVRSMRLNQGIAATLAFLCALAMGNAAANADGYQFIELYDFRPPAGFNTFGFRNAYGGQVAGSGSSPSTGNNDHALLWSGPPESVVDLNPNGFGVSETHATNGSQQVGYAGSDAALWSDTAASFVNLNPAGFSSSAAWGINGNYQAGDGTISGQQVALQWNGTAASAINLGSGPTGFSAAIAYATDGSQQVGDGLGTATSNNNHALLWSSTAASVVDLNPDGYGQSDAYGVSGNQQAGYGFIGGAPHALLWYGSAGSFVDLNPAGFTSSVAWDTDGSAQVGTGGNANGSFALLWTGSAATAINLGALLPSNFSQSQAFSIDSQGDVFGVADNSNNGEDSAIEWEYVPEPGSLGLLGFGGLGLLARPRCRRCRHIRGFNQAKG
jgi:hypothetical protein